MRFPIFGCLLLGCVASAHFVLQYPGSLGFDDDEEPNAPCGGEDITFDQNVTAVPVGGFPVVLLTTHPQAQFLYRGTLDKQGNNFTNLMPVVNEMGLGEFCLPHIKAPMTWAGQQGLVQIIMDGPDGILYQVCSCTRLLQLRPYPSLRMSLIWLVRCSQLYLWNQLVYRPEQLQKRFICLCHSHYRLELHLDARRLCGHLLGGPSFDQQEHSRNRECWQSLRGGRDGLCYR